MNNLVQLVSISVFYTRVKVKVTDSKGVIVVLQDFDFCFAENGLTAYRLGKEMASQVNWVI
jgi:hypothetical protein